jgi:hypothetical protein
MMGADQVAPIIEQVFTRCESKAATLMRAHVLVGPDAGGSLEKNDVAAAPWAFDTQAQARVRRYIDKPT